MADTADDTTKKTEKPASPSKVSIKVNDVAPADQSAPDPSSKPIIVTNRPMIKDPMVKEDTNDKKAEEPKPEVKREVKLKAPDDAPAEPDIAKTENPTEAEAEAPAAAEPAKTEAKSEVEPPKQDAQKDAEAIEAAEAAKQAEQEAAIQKLAEDKKYYLPINAVEQRKSRRFVLLGVVLSLLLILTWIDVAMDAGLIQIGNIKPVTHFFSN